MFSRVEHTDRSVFERCTVCVKRCMLEVHLVVFVWNILKHSLNSLNKADVCRSVPYSSTRTQILPRFLPKYRIKNLRKTVIFCFLFSLWMPKLADLKMAVEQTGWIWSFWSSVFVVLQLIPTWFLLLLSRPKWDNLLQTVRPLHYDYMQLYVLFCC